MATAVDVPLIDLESDSGDTFPVDNPATGETVAELRSLSRGIAPPLLIDRGLAAALDEMLSQSVVPVTSTVDVPGDLPPHVVPLGMLVPGRSGGERPIGP